jgi:ribosomal protein L20
MKYSIFINTLLKKEIKLDRKVLATLANERPEAFNRVVATIK